MGHGVCVCIIEGNFYELLKGFSCSLVYPYFDSAFTHSMIYFYRGINYYYDHGSVEYILQGESTSFKVVTRR